MISGDYPTMMQSEWEKAPFNQTKEELYFTQYKEFIMSQTLSKVFENVPCSKFNPTEQEAIEALNNDYRYSIEQLLTKSSEVLTEMRDYLRDLQRQKLLPPQEDYKINKLFLQSSRVIGQLSDWEVDDTTVMEN